MEVSYASTFGEVLRAFRLRAKMSQRELARQLGIHASTFGEWERGEVLPFPQYKIAEIARVLHLNEQDTKLLLATWLWPGLFEENFSENVARPNMHLTTTDITNTLLISIEEEPLTAQNLAAAITAITDLYTRCWLIQQRRFSDLMDYAQTHNPRFVKEANLQIGIMSHNSPALIDFLLNAGTIAGGAATLVVALSKAIDAVAQTPLRFEATKLKNQRERQEQAIRAKQALLDQKIALEENKIHKVEFEKAAKQQEQHLEAQRKQLDLERQRMLLEIEKQKLEVEAEKQRTALDRERLEFEKNRVVIVQEIAVTMVGQLLSSEDREDAGRTEMLVHSLIPSLLQLAATDAIVTAIPAEKPKEENKDSSEDKS